MIQYIKPIISTVILSLLGFGKASSDTYQKCIICEHIGFAGTEFAAHLNLLGVREFQAAQDASVEGSQPGLNLRNLYLDSDGDPMVQQNNYCLTAMVPIKNDATPAPDTFNDGNADINHSPPTHIQTIGSGTNGYSYCVAQFFVYYAQDINR